MTETLHIVVMPSSVENSELWYGVRYSPSCRKARPNSTQTETAIMTNRQAMQDTVRHIEVVAEACLMNFQDEHGDALLRIVQRLADIMTKNLLKSLK